MSRFFLSLGLFVFLCVPAMAGNLFPPDNIGANPNAPCPNNQTLKWTGNSLVCADPSPGVTISNCPAGQVLVGISNGAPQCQVMDTAPQGTYCGLLVKANADQTPGPIMVDIPCKGQSLVTGGDKVSCPAGYIMNHYLDVAHNHRYICVKN